MTAFVVAVDVTTVWTSPAAPRAVDALAIADSPDPVGWLAELDRFPDDDETGNGRLGLHGRVDTQAVRGEPALVLEQVDGWARVVLPWQPSRLDPRGYPGWLPRAHLRMDASADPVAQQGDPVTFAREHLGVAYLWGGMSPLGLDCSGLVHWVWRRLGVRVPRDADDQCAAAQPVPLGQERTGDLYFFAKPGAGVHHVGIVVEPGRMLHAPETGARIVEEPMTPERTATLSAAGRFPAVGTPALSPRA